MILKIQKKILKIIYKKKIIIIAITKNIKISKYKIKKNKFTQKKIEFETLKIFNTKI